MRQGQQNRRGRGRGRKVQNPLSRNFESNGPDVKIRGNASHIAEKYSTLARDALAAGDTVTAENFLQHAEHYNRIIMSAQTQSGGSGQQPSDGANGSGNHRGQDRDDDDGNDSQGADDGNARDAEVRAVESGKGNGRSRSRKDAGGKDDDAQQGDDVSSESDNAAA